MRRVIEHAERIARHFHEEYERLAPKHGWETQERTRVAWEALPAENRQLMISVVIVLMRKGIIQPGPTQLDPVRKPGSSEGDPHG